MYDCFDSCHKCLERLMDLQAAQRNQLLLTASQEKLSGLPPAGCKHTLDCKKNPSMPT